jgi:PAS domain S-box-containing protein
MPRIICQQTSGRRATSSQNAHAEDSMIWNSVPLMTAIDLLIIAVIVYGVWRCRLLILRGRPRASSIGGWLIALGLLVICLFYFADLVSMHVLSVVTSPHQAMALMDALHSDLSWPVVLFAAVTISIGLVKLLVELQEGEARVRRLVDSNIIGVFIWKLEGQIIDANDAFLRTVGYDREDLISGRLRWTHLTPPEWLDRDERWVPELKRTGSLQPFEKEYLRKDGSRVPVLIGMAIFEDRGNQGVGFVLDLTERKRAEEGLRGAQMELAHVNRVATMGQLAASIAHDIKQPLTAVVSSSEAASSWLCMQPPNLDEAKAALARIDKAGILASDVVDRLRNLFRKGPARKDRLDINETVHDVIALIRGEVSKNGVSLQTQLTDDLPTIQADRVQLQQVILNLIINAVEAMRDAGEQSRELLISTGKDATGGVLVAVHDSGPGLNPDSADRIFDAFYTTKPGGMGMGLSICRSIIEAHGRRLWASAKMPHGATFQFTVPAQEDALQPIGSRAKAA